MLGTAPIRYVCWHSVRCAKHALQTPRPPNAHANSSPPRFSSFLEGVDRFDAAAFGLSEAEALLIDPQQRLLLEAAGEALALASASAGVTAGAGVYVGITSTEYAQLAQRHARGFTPYSATGFLTTSVAAGRLSYTFGLRGPSLPVDTVCSSSLVRQVGRSVR